MKKIAAGSAFTILFLVLLSLALSSPASADAPAFDPADWAYNQSGTVTASGECGELTDYQVRFTLQYGSGTNSGSDFYLGGLCQPDFDDIRFTKADGVTLLDYWMQEVNAGSDATVWVEFDQISPAGTDFYIHYGNPNATSASDGDATFPFFDDFEDGVIDTDKWTEIYDDGGFVREEDGVLKALGSTSGFRVRACVWSKFIPSDIDVKVYHRVMITNIQMSGDRFFDFAPGIRNVYFYPNKSYHTYSTALVWKTGFIWANEEQWQSLFSWTQFTGFEIPPLNGTYHDVVTWVDSDKTGYTIVDGLEQNVSCTHPFNTGQTAYVRTRISGENSNTNDGCIADVFTDHVFARYYCGPEPTISWGEEPQPTPTPQPTETPAPTPTPEPTETPVPTATPEGPCAWASMDSGTTENVKDIWGASPNDMFAVALGGVILHYDGNSWSSMGSGTTEDIRGIWGTASTDIFAVGDRGGIWHYDGSSWSAMYDGSLAPKNRLEGVWGTSSSDVFAVGGYLSGGNKIRHYDGSSWSAMDSGTTKDLWFGWSSSPSNAYVVGGMWDEDDGGVILHYDGTSWTKVNTGPINSLRGIWGSSPTDIFATGCQGAILHYDGTSWTQMDSGTTQVISAVWGSSSNNVYAVGRNGTILHYDGTSWSDMDSPTTVHIKGMRGLAPSDVFAVGANGLILHYICDGVPPTPTPQPTVNTVYFEQPGYIQDKDTDFETRVKITFPVNCFYGAQFDLEWDHTLLELRSAYTMSNGKGSLWNGSAWHDASFLGMALNGPGAGGQGHATVLVDWDGYIAMTGGFGINASAGYLCDLYWRPLGNTGATDVLFQETLELAALCGGPAYEIDAVWTDTTVTLVETLPTPTATPPAESADVWVDFVEVPGMDVALNVATNDKFTVRTNISGVENLKLAQYDITYDPGVIKVITTTGWVPDVSAGEIGGEAFPVQAASFVPQETQGRVRIIHNLEGVQGVSGSGYMSSIEFQVIGSKEETSPICISIETLANTALEPIPYTVTNASVLVVLPWQAGDANTDGHISLLDLGRTRNIILHSLEFLPSADSNLDGDITVFDLGKTRFIIMGN